jgi:hypothetical protein
VSSPEWRTPEPLDFELSPHTGLRREHWAATADRMLLALRPYFSPARSRVQLPGRTSAYGSMSDGLEGFARSLLLAGFRIAGEHGEDPHGFLDWYRAGLIAGTSPASAERWPRLTELAQARVEAASIVLVLELTRPWLWDTLSTVEQGDVISWLEDAVGAAYPPNNWVWFRAVIETFLADVGGRFAPHEIESTLSFHASCRREHGWYSDGADQRSYDYYCGWAMQFYPFIWAAQPGATRFGAEQRLETWRQDLAEFLDDYVHLIGSDGMPVLQGRSLVYRFAAAAPLWSGAAVGVPGVDPGLLRRAASGLLRAFVERGVPDGRGLLNVGLTREWPRMAQSYTGSGSPYWAAKGMYGLALAADHPVWTAVEAPLPIERGDVRRLIVAPGWLLSGTSADGVVRIVNHGTDHDAPGSDAADSPLYARFGYSSTTAPLVSRESIAHPIEQLATVIDGRGAVAHRSGFRVLRLDDDGTALIGASQAAAHWVAVEAQDHDYGSGYTGRSTPGPEVAVTSVVRGAWEVRIVRVFGTAGSAAAIRVSGWPLVPDYEASDLRAALVPLAGASFAEVETAYRFDDSPLADLVSVSQITVPLCGASADSPRTVVVAIGLGSDLAAPPALEPAEGGVLAIRWGDSTRTEVQIA